jgi:hypothetical protein
MRCFKLILVERCKLSTENYRLTGNFDNKCASTKNYAMRRCETFDYSEKSSVVR